MSAEIIILQNALNDNDEPRPGNGALEVVRDYFDRVQPARCEGIDELPAADNFLAWLWEQGFMVIPIPEDEPAA